MKVLVDADACPVKNIIIDICSKKNIPVLLFVDTSHILSSPKCQVITVDKGRDSVDIALLNKTLKNDIVVTQDYGVAAMALGRGAHAINEKGLMNYIINNNIHNIFCSYQCMGEYRKTHMFKEDNPNYNNIKLLMAER